MMFRSSTILLLTIAATARAQCPDGSLPPCAGARADAPGPRSVAVLNFRLLSRDTTDAYLAEGLADAITSRLSQVRRLDVASRTAARLGRTPRAAYVVSGTMLRQNRQLVVNVELLRASTGRNVWAQRYERSDTAVLGTEQEIALRVASGILPSVTAEERAALGVAPTSNPEAYDHLLRGDFYIARRTLAATTRAIQEYETAARIDPALARAPARIALACALWLDWQWDPAGRPAPDSVLAKGIAAAARAIALDSMSSDAWMATAYITMWSKPRTMEGVEAGFLRAIALDPRNAEAHHQYADWLSAMNRGLEGVPHLRAALAIDPLRPATLRNLGMQLGVHGGLPLIDSAVSLDPDFGVGYGMRAFLRLQTGDTSGVREDLRRGLERVAAESRINYLGNAAALMTDIGDTAAARALARQGLDALAPTGPLGTRTGSLLAAMYELGDRETAIGMTTRVQPRGALFWFLAMEGRTDTSAIPEPIRSILEESRPPWVH